MVKEIVTLRIPGEIRGKIEDRRRGRFTTVSEYIRDLIRRDVEDCPPVLVPVTENFRKPDGAMPDGAREELATQMDSAHG